MCQQGHLIGKRVECFSPEQINSLVSFGSINCKYFSKGQGCKCVSYCCFSPEIESIEIYCPYWWYGRCRYAADSVDLENMEPLQSTDKYFVSIKKTKEKLKRKKGE